MPPERASPASKRVSTLESAAVVSDLACNDVREEVGVGVEVGVEESLLIEAVSLLVQRQRETETWVTEQVWQAEQRAATSERRYAELEARLVDIEEQLTRLLRDTEPGRSDAAVEERLARLREQVEDLKTGGDGRPAHTVTVPGPTPPQAGPVLPREFEPAPAPPPPVRPARVAATAGGSSQSPGLLELLGATPQDRFGIALIGLGAVAVLYAILTQLPLR